MEKVGRNDKCYCGSGKKYKNCCIQEGENFKKLYERMEENLQYSIRLLTSIEQSSIDTNNKSKNGYGRLLDAHMMATSAVGSMIIRKNIVPGKTTPSISGRLSLIASFIKGIPLCEQAISNGLYEQASNLLKQELESIAAIEEYAENSRKNRKTPNVKYVKWNLGTLYGD